MFKGVDEEIKIEVSGDEKQAGVDCLRRKTESTAGLMMLDAG